MKAADYRNFGDPLLVTSGAFPDYLAFLYLDDDGHEQRVTFSELHQRALGIARDLLAAAQPGDRALLLLPPGLDYVATIFGCFYAGIIGVSAPPPQPRQLERTLNRLLKIAESAGTTIAITTTPFEDAARAVLPDGHPLTEAHWLTADTSAPGADESVVQSAVPGDVAFLQYTSGSTADPRGVMLSHANLLDNSRFIAQAFDHNPEQSLGFNWIPPFHDMGLIGAILQPVYLAALQAEEGAGERDPERAVSVLASPLAVVRRPIQWLQGVSRYRATTSGGPNFAYDMCVERIDPAECDDLDLSSWEVAFNGAEPIRAETMSAFATKFRPYGFRPTAFFPVYGLAEATLMVTAPKKAEEPATMRFDGAALLENLAVPSDDPKDPLLVGCGGPDSRHCLKIVDPETEEVCPAGSIGEIWVSGPSVARGYWSSGTDSGRTFEAALAGADDGDFLRTGDLGVIVEEELYVLGRLSDLIIVKGRNHHPHDIESLAEAASPLLIPHTSAAFELQPSGGEPLIALVTESKSTDETELRNALSSIRAKVAEELGLPLGLTAVCRKGSVPKTTSGKIQRRLCRTLLLEGDLEIIAEWRSPVAQALPAA